MRTRCTAAFALTLAFMAAAPFAPAKEGKKGGTAVLMPAGDLKWNDVPGFPGVTMAVLQGDPAKGAHHTFIKFKDGFAAPLHHHSSDHFGTVVSGTLILTVDGKDTTLPAGSFFCFKGMKKHMTRCAPGSDCVLSMDVRGKWDVVPAKEAAAKK